MKHLLCDTYCDRIQADEKEGEKKYPLPLKGWQASADMQMMTGQGGKCHDKFMHKGLWSPRELRDSSCLEDWEWLQRRDDTSSCILKNEYASGRLKRW